jgi:hypothetical protein
MRFAEAVQGRGVQRRLDNVTARIGALNGKKEMTSTAIQLILGAKRFERIALGETYPEAEV